MLEKKRSFILLGLLSLTTSWLQAANIADTMKEGVSAGSFPAANEINADAGYVAGSKAHLGSADFGNVTEQNSRVYYAMSHQLEEGTLLRLGVEWQRFTFGLPVQAPLPNLLQSVSMVLGADLELTDQWLMRVEIEPGVYSDFQDISFDDVNSPLIVGFTYLVDENLQWFFGLSVNPRRSLPILPGAGVRWKFADPWTLMLVFPRPRLEYEVNKNTILYLGGEIKGDTYKVAQNFGNPSGHPSLNNKTVDFTEIRLGAGFSWRVTPGINLEIDGGYMMYRQFDFSSADTSIDNNNLAPYGQITIRGNF